MRFGRAISPAMASRANCDSWTTGSCATVWRRVIRVRSFMLASMVVDKDPSISVISQSHTTELPARRRIEEIAISHARVALRCCLRAAAKHHLIDHEFAIVFAQGARYGPITRVRQVGAA